MQNSAKFKLLIYIPSYNRFEKLTSQLKILSPQMSSDVKIIVMDNSSSDERYLSLQSNEMIEYRRNAVNIGIVGNILKGFEYDPAEYVWILSDDEHISDNVVSKIINEINKHQPDLIYLEAKIIGEDKLKGRDSIKGSKEILGSFASVSMTGLISANVYRYVTFKNHVHEGYRFGNTLFPHSAIFYSCLASNRDLHVRVIYDCLKWNFGEITYQHIHDQSWSHYLDLTSLFSRDLQQVFIDKFLSNWAVSHYIKIMIRDKNILRMLMYSLKYKFLFVLTGYSIKYFSGMTLQKVYFLLSKARRGKHVLFGRVRRIFK